MTQREEGREGGRAGGRGGGGGEREREREREREACLSATSQSVVSFAFTSCSINSCPTSPSAMEKGASPAKQPVHAYTLVSLEALCKTASGRERERKNSPASTLCPRRRLTTCTVSGSSAVSESYTYRAVSASLTRAWPAGKQIFLSDDCNEWQDNERSC